MKNPDEKQTVGGACISPAAFLEALPKRKSQESLDYRGNWRSREEEEEEDAVVEDLATSIVV
jgi:hypothetical protein